MPAPTDPTSTATQEPTMTTTAPTSSAGAPSLADRMALALAIRHALGHQAVLRGLRARPMPSRRRRRAQARHIRQLGACYDGLARHVATIARVSGWTPDRVRAALAAHQADWPIPTATELVIALCPELNQVMTPGRQVLLLLEQLDRPPGVALLTDLVPDPEGSQ